MSFLSSFFPQTLSTSDRSADQFINVGDQVYAVGVCGANSSPDSPIALGSFRRAKNDNFIFLNGAQYAHRLPPSAIAWSPFHSNVFASTSTTLRVWKTGTTDQPMLKLASQKSAPSAMTSLDFSPAIPNKLVTAQTDATVSVWDIEKGKQEIHMIAHDGPVLNVGFVAGESSPNVLASVSQDGSVRIFDLRDLEHSTVAYENANALIRVAWNKSADGLHKIAVLPLDSKEVLLFDLRMIGSSGATTAATCSPSAGRIQTETNVNCIAFGPNNTLVAGLVSGSVDVFSSTTKERLTSIVPKNYTAGGVVNIACKNDKKSSIVYAVHDTGVSVIKAVFPNI